MNDNDQTQLGKTLWNITDQLRGAMNADDFRDYMLSFLFLRYLSDNYEAAAKKELGADYPKLVNGEATNGATTPLAVWYKQNKKDIADFEKQKRRFCLTCAIAWGRTGSAKSSGWRRTSRPTTWPA